MLENTGLEAEVDLLTCTTGKNAIQLVHRLYSAVGTQRRGPLILPVTAISRSRRAYGDGGRGKKRQTCSLGLWRTVQTSGGSSKTILLGPLYVGTFQKFELRREPAIPSESG